MGSITEIKGKKATTYRAQVRKNQGGKLVYSEAKTFKSRKAAQAWIYNREVELESPDSIKRIQQAQTTVSDLIERYIKDFCQSAGRTKRTDIERLKTYEIALLPISRLNSSVLISHIAERLKSVKPQTAQNDLIWLRNIFKAAYPAWGIHTDSSEIDAAMNFCRKKGMIRRPETRDRRPTEDELKRLSAYFQSRDGRADIPMHDIMWFAIHSARREGEICCLLWSDNDSQALTGKVRDIKHPRKKGIDRAFKYTQEGWDIVQRQPRIDDRIFPYNAKSVSAAFTRACHMLEIEDLRFHDLRREAVSRLFEAGYSIIEVVQFSLHGDWQTLKIYTELKPGEVALR